MVYSNNCIRRRQACPGYKDDFDVVLKDQTTKLPERIQKRRAVQARRQAKLNSALGLSDDHPLSATEKQVYDEYQAIYPSPVAKSGEYEALCFFFDNYATAPRDDLTNRGFFEYILPVFETASSDSPAALATIAVAANMHTLWRYEGPDQPFPHSCYTRAVSSTKAAIGDPNLSKSDNLLLAVLLLDFYDVISRRLSNKLPPEQHQDGALALVRHRGKDNFKTGLGVRLLFAIRHRCVTAALEGRGAFECDGPLWDEEANMPSNPAIELDLLCCRFGKIQKEAASIPSFQALIQRRDLSGLSIQQRLQDDGAELLFIMQRAMLLDNDLMRWYESAPKDWRAVLVAKPDLHPSIQAAGVYGSHCEVFPHIHVARVINLYRCARILVLQVTDRCLELLETPSQQHITPVRLKIRADIQSLVDEICSTVPFFLGNRTAPSSPYNDWNMQYPYHPKSSNFHGSLFMTANETETTRRLAERHHIRSAASMGGWFLLGNLVTLLKAFRPAPGAEVNSAPKLYLRKGQVEWVLGQLRRLQKIYLIPIPTKT